MPKKESPKKPAKEEKSTKQDEQIKELEEQLMRLSADFANYRKRVEEEKIAMRKNAKVEIFAALLPLLDNFSRAVGCAPDDQWSRGVCQIFATLQDDLCELGLRRIETAGTKFDSQKHEALMTDAGERDAILEELQAGWEVDGRVVRPAKVKVGNGEK